MTDNPMPDAELTDTKPTITDSVSGMVEETEKFIGTVGKAIITTLEDVSSLMLIKVNSETREHLDLLVDAGAVKNRRQAAVSLLQEGISSKSETFERVRRTQAQIAELRQQMRSLVKVRA